MTPDEIETLATGFVPASWASFLGFDAAAAEKGIEEVGYIGVSLTD